MVALLSKLQTDTVDSDKWISQVQDFMVLQLFIFHSLYTMLLHTSESTMSWECLS